MSFTKKYCSSPLDKSGSFMENAPCKCEAEPLHIANVRDVHFQSLIPIGSGNENVDNIIEHIDAEKGSVVPEAAHGYICDKCGKSFIRPQFLNRHIKTDHPITFLCDECIENFSNSHLLMNHIKKMHLSSQDKTCPICNMTFSSELLANSHVQNTHNPNVNNIEEHKSKSKCNESNAGNFCCNDCNYTTLKKANLDWHVKSKHKTVHINPKARILNATMDTNNNNTLPQNIYIASEAKKCPCPFCKK